VDGLLLRWTRRVGVSYRKGAYLSPTARQFIGILKSRPEVSHRNRWQAGKFPRGTAAEIASDKALTEAYLAA